MPRPNFEVINGGRTTSKRLCDTCEHGVILRGASESEELVYCNEMMRPVAIQVVECNRYKEGGTPSLWDMRQIAWVLNTDPNRQKIGFQADDLLADFDFED
jgi:hypothetical protein